MLEQALLREEAEDLFDGSTLLSEAVNELVGFVEDAENTPMDLLRELTVIRLALLQLTRVRLINASKSAGLDLMSVLVEAEEMTRQALRVSSIPATKA